MIIYITPLEEDATVPNICRTGLATERFQSSQNGTRSSAKN
jgi:hypothetical protein